MIKFISVLAIWMSICSCTTYLDKGQSIHNDHLDFNYTKNYNEFIYKSNTNSVADNQLFLKTHFSINLPKKIKFWIISSNEFFFEYRGKQIIYINSGYKNEKSIGNWSIQEPTSEKIYSLLRSYWNSRNYKEEKLTFEKAVSNSKIYTDGNVLILLYNIKQENFAKYMELVKSFKYLN